MEIFDILTKLNECHGPSGDEAGIRDAIAELVRPYADDVTTDTLGNLIAHRGGSGSKIMLSAHMDSIGLMVTHFEKNGMVRVGRLGGIDHQATVYTPFRFKNGTSAMLVKEEKVEMDALKMDHLALDLGVAEEAEARKLVQVGDTAVVDAPVRRLGKHCVAGPYMDNRISCAILISALAQMKERDNDIYMVFSVQEEVGCRGAKTAAYAIDPDYGIAVDVTSTNDEVGTANDGTSKLGGGVAIKVMDRSVLCSLQAIEQLEAIAERESIKTQRDIMKSGGTDGGPMSVNRCGVHTGGVSVPCRYIHTPVETVDLRDVTACVALVVALSNHKLKEVPNGIAD